MRHVCFCFTDSSGEYYRNTLVSLFSVLEHTKSKLCIHILSDDTFTPERKQLFEDLCSRYGQELKVHSLEEIPEEIYRNIPENFGKGSLFRLFIPDLIEEDLVLYLDCDIICQIDVQTIFDIDIGDACLGGILDSAVEDVDLCYGYIDKLGIDPTHYINSGVLLMNNAELRRSYPDLREIVLLMIRQVKTRFPDQDALNFLFPLRTGDPPAPRIEPGKKRIKDSRPDGDKSYPREAEAVRGRNGKVHLLPGHFNYPTWPMERGYYPLTHYRGKLIHYTCKKPWTTLYPASLLYWKYYCRLFSVADAFERIEELELNRFTPLFHLLLQDDKSRRWFGRMYEVSRQGILETLLDRVMPARRKKKQRSFPL